LRSSKSHRDRLGVTLAGMLGLTGITLLVLARPFPTPVFHRSPPEDGFETREAARQASPATVLEDAPPAARPFAARRPAWTRPSPPPLPLPAPSSEEPLAAPADSAPAPTAQTAPRGLVAILRASGLACLGGREALLSPAERELCRERLGAQASASLPAIAPEQRATYDALAQAQRPRRALVPLTARGAGGSFTGDDRLRAGRRPRVGCALRFGPNADQASDDAAGGLRAGPCFLQPPAGAPAADPDRRGTY
jgi:hypothetical protein